MNAPTTIHGNTVRKAAAIQAVQERYYREWMKVSADMNAEIERIKNAR